MPETEASSGGLTWLDTVVEPTAALVAASGVSTSHRDALVTDWQYSEDPVSLLLACLEDETLPASTRSLAVLLLVIEMSDRGRDAILADIARRAPSLAGRGLSLAVDLSPFALAALMGELEMWSSRPPAPLTAVLDRLENDRHTEVGSMCALAVAMMGTEDVVEAALLRQLRSALRPRRAAAAALGLALCGGSAHVETHLREGARTDPHEEVRGACYAALSMVGCDASEGLFDVHSEVRRLVVLLLDVPLTAQQRSRLARVMGDKALLTEERVLAAAGLLSDDDIDELVPQIAAFLTGCDAPEGLPLIDYLLSTGRGSPEIQEQLAAAAQSRRART